MSNVLKNIEITFEKINANLFVLELLRQLKWLIASV